MKYLLFIPLLFICLNANAADRFICDTTTSAAGDGTGGTEANCADGGTLSEWQEAIDALTAGNTLSIRAGQEYPTSSTLFALNSPAELMELSVDGTDGSPITITSYGTGNDPLIKGDRTVSDCDDGGYGIKFTADTDWWVIKNIDLQGFRHGITTLAANGNLPRGKCNNIVITNVKVEQSERGFFITGHSDGDCSSGCNLQNVPSDRSSDWTFTDVESNNFCKAGFVFKNGIINVTMDGVIVNGGGPTYDVDSSGQQGLDIGRTSGGTIAGGTNGYTPDRNFIIKDIQVTNINNTQSASSRNSDGIKTEALSQGTITGGFATLASQAGIDSKGDWYIKDFVLYKNLFNLKSYSGNKSNEADTFTNITTCENCLLHTAESQGGTEAGAAVQSWGNVLLIGSTIINTDSAQNNLFNIQTNFGDTHSIVLRDTVYGTDENSVVDTALTGGDSGHASLFTDEDSNAYCYDNKGTIDMCSDGAGTNPIFSDSDSTYNGVTVDGVGWNAGAFSESIGWRFGSSEPPPPPPIPQGFRINALTLRGVTIIKSL